MKHLKSLLSVLGILAFVPQISVADFVRTANCTENGSTNPWVFVVATRTEFREFGQPNAMPPWNRLEETKEVYRAGAVTSAQVRYGMTQDFLEVPNGFIDQILSAATEDELARVKPVEGTYLILDYDNHG